MIAIDPHWKALGIGCLVKVNTDIPMALVAFVVASKGHHSCGLPKNCQRTLASSTDKSSTKVVVLMI
jgi:hypothetical protein